LKNVEGLAFQYFDESDVVRHHLVQRIIRAYDERKARAADAAAHKAPAAHSSDEPTSK
jgi:phosphate starvation-inducible PhoH-like protein